MTYQGELILNKYVTFSIDIGMKYKKGASWMHEAAKFIRDEDVKYFEAKEKLMSDDHMKQMLVKLAKK